MCRVMEWIIAWLLVMLSYSDWKTKRVPAWLLGLTMLAAILSLIFASDVSAWETIGGILVGLLFFGVSKWTREALGYGDSWLILSLGICKGAVSLLEILFFASLFVSLFSMLYCIGRGWSRKRTFPYIPFITVAYLGGMFW